MSETRALTDQEIFRLFDELKGEWRPLARFLLHTGLRVSEAFSLSPRDVDRDLAGVVIRAAVSKTRYARRVPLNLSAQRAWRLAYHHPRAGRSVTWSRSSQRAPVRSFQLALAAAAARAGIAGRVSPHTLRHTFASRLAGAGVNLRVVQELLGHRRLSSTQHYLHTTQEDLTAAVRMLE